MRTVDYLRGILGTRFGCYGSVSTISSAGGGQPGSSGLAVTDASFDDSPSFHSLVGDGMTNDDARANPEAWVGAVREGKQRFLDGFYNSFEDCLMRKMQGVCPATTTCRFTWEGAQSTCVPES